MQRCGDMEALKVPGIQTQRARRVLWGYSAVEAYRATPGRPEKSCCTASSRAGSQTIPRSGADRRSSTPPKRGSGPRPAGMREGSRTWKTSQRSEGLDRSTGGMEVTPLRDNGIALGSRRSRACGTREYPRCSLVTRDPERQECSRVRHSNPHPYSGDPEVRSSRPQTSIDGLRGPWPRASRCSVARRDMS